MPVRRRSAALALVLLGSALLPASGWAKLDNAEWRKVQEESSRLFAAPGQREAKAAVVARLVEDGEARAWKILSDALVQEAEHWVACEQRVAELVEQIAGVLKTPSAKRYPKDEENLFRWQGELGPLEAGAAEERAILGDVTRAVAEGPEALRKALFARARGPVQWPVRAAAARVAAARPGEAASFEVLQRALSNDKDPRVRMAALEALREHQEKEGDSAALLDTVESLIIGRLADEEWGVQLLAVRVLEQRGVRAAIPHLINALEKSGPRVAEAMGGLLNALTGQNFEPYADVWAKWWQENKESFASSARVRGGTAERTAPDATFYGLPIKSDRVVFLIDISDSMKHETKNENPAAGRPAGPVTPRGEGAPPPPPEEIMSGPKIDVAKDELKKALRKLPRTTYFNIIAYNHTVLQWKDQMMPATDAVKEDALTWLRSLQPSGSTYIDGALRLAFRLAGLGAVDRQYRDVNVDTMILLSDGAPTDNASPSKSMDPEIILQHVREWNVHKRIVIHTIGVDMVDGVEFLVKLSGENGGTHIDR